MDRFTQYAVVAAREAVKDAKLNINEDTANRIGVWIGSGIGGMETFELSHSQLLERGPRRVSPFFVPMLIPDMATGQVSIDLGAKGRMVLRLQHVLQVQTQLEKLSRLFNAVMPMLWLQVVLKRQLHIWQSQALVQAVL